MAEKVTASLANDGRLWERVTATLAQIAERNMPGWDAGEMATAALREVDAYLRKSPEGRPWCLCDPGVGPHDLGCPAASAKEPGRG